MAVLKYKSSDGTWKTIATKGGNGVTDETDPVFSASPAASITEEKKAEWDRKYTKPSGGIPASDLASDVFLQGEKGDKGDKGDTGADGEDGATFTPSVDANGNLSWTNNKGLSNPPTVNIKGPKGDSGEGGGGNTEGISMKVETITPLNDAIAFIGTGERSAMKPNTIYVQAGDSANDVLLTLSIYAFEETSDAYAEYVIIFIFNSPRATDNMMGLEVPSDIKWANGEVPTLEANVVYELNIARSVVAGQVSYNAVLTPFKQVE